jgi:hypothetical protein
MTFRELDTKRIIHKLEVQHQVLLSKHKQTSQALHGAEAALTFLTGQRDEQAKQLQELFEKLNELRNQ